MRLSFYSLFDPAKSEGSEASSTFAAVAASVRMQSVSSASAAGDIIQWRQVSKFDGKFFLLFHFNRSFLIVVLCLLTRVVRKLRREVTQRDAAVRKTATWWRRSINR